MYTKSFIAVLITYFSLISFCSAATLVWDASTGTVDGYKVYYGTSATNPSESVNVGNVTQYAIDSLPLSENVQYYFCVSAYNTAGESDPCAPVAYTPSDTTPPTPPIGLVAHASSASNGNTEVALWWTTYSNRSSNVPVDIYDGANLLDTVTVDQKTNGGQWNVLGSYTFSSQPKVVIRAVGSDSTCADAVKLTDSNGNESIIDNGASGTSYTGTWKISIGTSYYGSQSLFSSDGATYTFAL